MLKLESDKMRLREIRGKSFKNNNRNELKKSIKSKLIFNLAIINRQLEIKRA